MLVFCLNLFILGGYYWVFCWKFHYFWGGWIYGYVWVFVGVFSWGWGDDYLENLRILILLI